MHCKYWSVTARVRGWPPENFDTATAYEDNLIAKTFAFQFINSYFSLVRGRCLVWLCVRGCMLRARHATAP